MLMRRPTEKSLERIMKLVSDHGGRPVRAALVSHALVKGAKEE